MERSTVKRYGCVFTCFAIRALHIEIPYDFITDSFIQAFVRSVSGRRPPRQVYSGNGTNFNGAEAEITCASKDWYHHRIRNSLRIPDLEWHFNPPPVSHVGGVWETMVGSIRKILRSLTGNQFVNDEILLTVNDRPLIHLTNDPNNIDSLIPSNLLLLYTRIPAHYTKTSVTRSTWTCSAGNNSYSNSTPAARFPQALFTRGFFLESSEYLLHLFYNESL